MSLNSFGYVSDKPVDLPLPWPERYFHDYHGPRGYAGPNGVLGPWRLPEGFSYTGEVKEGLTRAEDGGTWGISYSGNWGPFHPVLMAPLSYGSRYHDYLVLRRKSEGHNCGYIGPGDSPKLPIFIVVHENASPLKWLDAMLAKVRRP